ncbi:MAG: PilW family protein, partial [Vampirovibrionia bacterium]
MNNKGFTLVEMLISSMILTILMLSLAQLSFNFLNIADKHSNQIEKTQYSRFSLERMTEQIHNAAYIFPKGQDISFSIEKSAGASYTYSYQSTNTDNAIALLVPFAGKHYYEDSETPIYNLIIYYLESNADGTSNLIEFSTSEPCVYWSLDSIPTEGSPSGTSTILAKNIKTETSNLTY